MVFFPWPLSHDKGSFQVHLGAADPSALLQLGVLGERFHSVGVQDLKAGGTVRRQRQGGLPSSWEPGLKNKGLQTGLRGDKSSPSVKTYEPFKVLRSQPALRVEIVWGEGAGQKGAYGRREPGSHPQACGLLSHASCPHLFLSAPFSARSVLESSVVGVGRGAAGPSAPSHSFLPEPPPLPSRGR